MGDLLKAHAASVTKIVTGASRELAPLIPADGSAEEKSDLIAKIILFLGNLGLREFSAQVGFVSTLMKVPADQLETIRRDFPFSELEVNIASGCIEPLNDVAHFARQ